MSQSSLYCKKHDRYRPFSRYSVNQSPVEWMRDFFSAFDQEYKESRNWAVGLDSGNYLVIGSSEMVLLLKPIYESPRGLVELEEYTILLPKWWHQT